MRCTHPAARGIRALDMTCMDLLFELYRVTEYGNPTLCNSRKPLGLHSVETTTIREMEGFLNPMFWPRKLPLVSFSGMTLSSNQQNNARLKKTVGLRKTKCCSISEALINWSSVGVLLSVSA